jgi:hypothetical protein
VGITVQTSDSSSEKKREKKDNKIKQWEKWGSNSPRVESLVIEPIFIIFQYFPHSLTKLSDFCVIEWAN